MYKFDPETGDREYVADTIDRWAAIVLDDYEAQTLWPLAHEWQAVHGPLASGQRLVPKTPFVLGGEYVIDNLYAADAVEAMRFYGNLATQLHDLPDGAQVRLKVVE